MKHIKLFEQSFSEEEKPLSITIELTDKFEEQTRESKNSDGNRGYTSLVTPITLFNNGTRYNMVKVATIPWDIRRDLQFDFWASYRPKANEIYVDQSSATAKDLGNSLLNGNSIPSTAGVVSKLTPGYYCKFENGFKVGEVDHRGYFRIVAVS
jgi:hypothetical protein